MNLSEMSPANGEHTGGEGGGRGRSGAGGEGITALDKFVDSQRRHEIQDDNAEHFMRSASSDTPRGLARTLGGSKNSGASRVQGPNDVGYGRRRDAMSMPPEDIRRSPLLARGPSQSRTFTSTHSDMFKHDVKGVLLSPRTRLQNTMHMARAALSEPLTPRL